MGHFNRPTPQLSGPTRERERDGEEHASEDEDPEQVSGIFGLDGVWDGGETSAGLRPLLEVGPALEVRSWYGMRGLHRIAIFDGVLGPVGGGWGGLRAVSVAR